MAQDFDLVLRAPEAVLPALADAAIKGAVVLAAAGLLVLALRRASAAARHLVWCLALAAVVALPVLSAVLPGWSLPLGAPWGQDAAPSPPAETFVAPGPVAQLPA